MPAEEQEQRNKVIGENIRTFRLQKGLTQEELAEGLCSVSQLSKAETGKVRLNDTMLHGIVQRLGVTLGQLTCADPVLDELQETFELACALGTEDERAWPLIDHVMERARELGYWDLYAGALLDHTHALFWQNRFAQIVELLTGVLAQGHPFAPYRQAALKLQLFETYKYLGDFVTASEYCRQAEQDVQDAAGQTEDELHVCYGLTKGYQMMREYRKSLAYAERTYRLAEELDNSTMRVRALSMRGHAYRLLGQWERAEASYQQGLQEAKNNGMVFGVGLLYNGLGHLYQQWGQLALAMTYFRRAVKVLEAGDYPLWVCEPLSHLAELAFDTGDVERAEQYGQQVLQLADQVSITVHHEKGLACKVLGRVQLARGDLAGYVRYLEEAIRTFGADYVGDVAYEVCVELAERLYEHGDPRAAAAYRQAIAYNQNIIREDRQVK